VENTDFLILILAYLRETPIRSYLYIEKDRSKENGKERQRITRKIKDKYAGEVTERLFISVIT